MRQLIKVGAFFIVLVAFTSCKKEKQDTNVPSRASLNQPPVANAGTDQNIILPTDSVELKGSGTDADGVIVNYEWVTLTGPSAYVFVINNNATSAKGLVEGRYEFQLKVTDNGGLSAKDNVVVYVLDPTKPDPCYGCWDY